MTTPLRPPRTLDDLKALTPARVGLGRVGAGLPTRALLDFTLDHARARDAVHAPFDGGTLAAELAGLGLVPIVVASQVADRSDYLKRPDLGRLLDASSEARLAERRQPPCDLVLVIGDGLSPAAVNGH
ncbi:MAG TPA: ethanolamine ammonia-lyase light chain EutC, partial [Tardiphaga sp.]